MTTIHLLLPLLVAVLMLEAPRAHAATGEAAQDLRMAADSAPFRDAADVDATQAMLSCQPDGPVTVTQTTDASGQPGFAFYLWMQSAQTPSAPLHHLRRQRAGPARDRQHRARPAGRRTPSMNRAMSAPAWLCPATVSCAIAAFATEAKTFVKQLRQAAVRPDGAALVDVISANDDEPEGSADRFRFGRRPAFRSSGQQRGQLLGHVIVKTHQRIGWLACSRGPQDFSHTGLLGVGRPPSEFGLQQRDGLVAQAI
ncbi:MAG TPA: hypothetical protein VGE36_11885 [Roseateles sp.]